MSSPTEDFRSQVQELLQKFVTAEGPDREAAAKEFSAILKKAKAQKDATPPQEGDCPDDVVDCEEIVSPCCGETLSNVFGTLPLQVACRKCGKRHFMGEIVRNSIKSKKSSLEV